MWNTSNYSTVLNLPRQPLLLISDTSTVCLPTLRSFREAVEERMTMWVCSLSSPQCNHWFVYSPYSLVSAIHHGLVLAKKPWSSSEEWYSPIRSSPSFSCSTTSSNVFIVTGPPTTPTVLPTFLKIPTALVLPIARIVSKRSIAAGWYLSSFPILFYLFSWSTPGSPSYVNTNHLHVLSWLFQHRLGLTLTSIILTTDLTMMIHSLPRFVFFCHHRSETTPPKTRPCSASSIMQQIATLWQFALFIGRF